MYSRGNYNFLRVVNARECASASDPFTVASTFEGTRVFSREECILACERLACVARASREVCYLSRERYCMYMYYRVLSCIINLVHPANSTDIM